MNDLPILELIAPTREAARKTLANLLDEAQRSSVYKGRTLLIENAEHVGADPNPHPSAAGARLLGLRQVDLDPLAGQVGRPRPAAMPPPPRRRGFGRWFRPRRRVRRR